MKQDILQAPDSEWFYLISLRVYTLPSNTVWLNRKCPFYESDLLHPKFPSPQFTVEIYYKSLLMQFSYALKFTRFHVG